MGKGALDDLVLIPSTVNTEFAQNVADYLDKPLAETERTAFNDSDMKLRIAESESVRGKHACLIMTYYPTVAERLHEFILWTDALISGAARGLTVVMPYPLGARQDRKTQRGEPINFRAFVNAIKGAAAEQVPRLSWITIDLHSPQLDGYSMVSDNLYALPMFVGHIRAKYENPKIVSPDTGGLKMAERATLMLGTDEPACFPQTRRGAGKQLNANIADLAVEGRNVILLDDIIDTGGTIFNAYNVLKERGARDIAVYASHLLLNKDAVEKIREFKIKVVGTDTVYHAPDKLTGADITRLPVSYIVGEVIKRQYLGISTRDLREVDGVLNACFGGARKKIDEF